MQDQEGSGALTKGLPAGFFALLFFLGSADQTFATRLGGMNFRWGQLLILAAAIWLLASGRLLRAIKALPRLDGRAKQALAAWVAFFTVYAIAALHASVHGLTAIKLMWAIFNIGGAAAVCLVAAQRPSVLREGLVLGVALVCGIIWIDSMALLWASLPGPIFGLAQDSMVFEHVLQMRPHAFYYEPSYAGAALAFVTPLLILATRGMSRWVRWGAPALTIATTVLTSARTGLLGLMLALAATVFLGVVFRAKGLSRQVIGSGVLALVVLTAFFAVTPRAGSYGRFILGPLGPAGIYARLTGSGDAWRHANGFGESEDSAKRVRQSSEVDRLGNLVKSFQHWRESFVLGWGVERAPAVDVQAFGRAIRPQVINTWLEVANESGLLGLLAFGAAIALTILAALKQTSDPTIRAVLLAAWGTHLVCNLNFTQTFPRLDYWLIFFSAVRLAAPSESAAVAASSMTDEPSSAQVASAST